MSVQPERKALPGQIFVISRKAIRRRNMRGSVTLVWLSVRRMPRGGAIASPWSRTARNG